MVELNFEENTLNYSPQEYCFSAAGEEQCLDMGEVVQGIEVDVLGYTAGYYEIDEHNLAIWDDECDYPTEQNCALMLTK